MRLHRKRGAPAWNVLEQLQPAFAPRASKRQKERGNSVTEACKSVASVEFRAMVSVIYVKIRKYI
jgi:hypothetical protein